MTTGAGNLAETRLQHVVLLDFPEALSADDDATLRSMVAAFPAKIGLMIECHFGSDLTGARTRGYDYLLYSVFADEDALHEYTVHPVHQELLRFLDGHNCRRLGFDYHLDGSTDAFVR
ncbi:MAG: Dabb family protein [Nocardioidaceae bacterium]